MLEERCKEIEIPRIEENHGQIKRLNKAKKKVTKANRKSQNSVKLLDQNMIKEMKNRGLGSTIGSPQFEEEREKFKEWVDSG